MICISRTFFTVIFLFLCFSLVMLSQAYGQTTWYVDDDNCPGGSGTSSDPFCTIQQAYTAASSGDTIMVQTGIYTEQINLSHGKNLTFTGAGRDVVTWIAPDGGYCIYGSMSGYTGSMQYEISGFTFDCRHNASVEWSTGILMNRASSGPLSLSIHDNRFIEDRASGDSDHWATSLLLCHNRYAARGTDGSGAVRVYNNIDETWGGMTMSNSQAYDIYDNLFDGCSDAIYNGHGCPDTAGQTFGDHHIYGNIFRNASDSLHPGSTTPALVYYYYGSGGGTHLPSTIEYNLFELNDTAFEFGMDTDMTYPVHMIENNCFQQNGTALAVFGDYVSTLNVENNWWGHKKGPYHETLNPGGKGDTITGDVDFDPWSDKKLKNICNMGHEEEEEEN